MLDRVSTYPGRVKLIPVEGQENTYDMIRADEPVHEGTALSKNNLLTDETAAAIFAEEGGSVPDTPDQALRALLNALTQRFPVSIEDGGTGAKTVEGALKALGLDGYNIFQNKYAWKRYQCTYPTTENTAFGKHMCIGPYNSSASINYSSDIKITVGESGSFAIELVNPTNRAFALGSDETVLCGKYAIYTKYPEYIVYFPEDATFSTGNVYTYYPDGTSVNPYGGSSKYTDDAEIVTLSGGNFSFDTILLDQDIDKYPSEGYLDGYYYYLKCNMNNIIDGHDVYDAMANAYQEGVESA